MDLKKLNEAKYISHKRILNGSTHKISELRRRKNEGLRIGRKIEFNGNEFQFVNKNEKFSVIIIIIGEIVQ